MPSERSTTRPDIRAERIRQGLTLPKLAEAVGISYDVCRKAEMGRPVREDSAKLLGDYFGCEPVVFVEPDAEEAAA